MFLDYSLRLANNVAVNGSGAADVGDVIDLQEGGRAIGSTMPLHLFLQLASGASGGTSIQFQLKTSSAVSGGNLSGGDEVELIMTDAIPRAKLVKGASLIMTLPGGTLIEYKRYLQLGVSRAGTIVGLSINAYLLDGPLDQRIYKGAPVPLV